MTPIQKSQHIFNQKYNQQPELTVYAPGRVNIIGEHTDYNDGFVMPCAINYGTAIAGAKRNDHVWNVYAADLDLSFKDAEKLKLNLNDGNIKPTVKRRVDEAIDKTLEVWLSGVELALSEFDNVDYLPNRILLCGGGSNLKKITEALEKHQWHEDLPFTKKPVVQYIKPSDVTGIIDTTGDIADHTFITVMGLLRVGYDTIIGNQESNGLVEKVNRLLKI